MAKKRSNKRSPAPPPSHPQGRSTTLTPEIHKEIVRHVREGNFFSTSCELAGISRYTGIEWLRRGRGVRDDRYPSEEFASFALAIEQAKAAAERDAIARIKEAATGRQTTKSKTVTKTYRDVEGNETVETTVEVVETTNYDWRADAWIQERLNFERWSANRMAELEAWKTLIEAGQAPEEVIDALLAGEDERRSRIQDALRPRQDQEIDHGVP